MEIFYPNFNIINIRYNGRNNTIIIASLIVKEFETFLIQYYVDDI